MTVLDIVEEKLKEESEETEIRQLLKLSTKFDFATDFPLHNVTKLDLSDCGLSQLPESFSTLLPNLSILFLSKNKFREMPEIIGKCSRLQMVAFKDNAMTSIHPDALQPQLRWLILTGNQISELPETIGRCKLLQKCMLSGNRLAELPESISNCTNLELIRLASNRLKEAPLTLLKIPSLCWVALSDNPFLEGSIGQQAELQPLEVLQDVDEEAGEVLGQGAGGVTRKVLWKGRPVAVKKYSGAMTSDGTPEQERRIATAAGRLNCPSLIQVLGETPTGSLVMEYLDNYQTLAGPPSMESCSRDVYDDETVLTWEQAEKMVSGLLLALTQLHNKGIIHGDFYAHNTLVKKDNPANVRLSDFGAAFFYDRMADYGKLLLSAELRSFAVLVDEVHDITADDQKAILKELASYSRKPSRTFEEVLVWWRQRQLSAMAKTFGEDVELPN
jgi:tRNA A-37 threonylcarbamoyl transferase component Bud32